MKKIVIACLLAGGVVSAYGLQVTNNTSFYLNYITSGGGPAENCPTMAPGETATLAGYYCGYDACSTAAFTADPGSPIQGCNEVKKQDPNNSGSNVDVQGGYATYFGINVGATASASACVVQPAPLYTPYQCVLDGKGGLTFNYLSLIQPYTSGPQKGSPVLIPAVSKYTSGPLFRGVNISGLEYDGTFLDGMYQQADIPDAQYFAAQGMNTVRLPIRAEFVIVDSASNPIESHNPDSTVVNTMYLNAVYDTAQKYLNAGLNVDLDLHNYMRFCPTGAVEGQNNEPTNPVANSCSILTAPQLAKIWTIIMTTPLSIPTASSGTMTGSFAALAQQHDSSASAQLILGLMNEPFSLVTPATQNLSTEDIFTAEVAAIKAIRAAGATNNLILLSGNGWDPLHAWLVPAPGANTTPDGKVFTLQGLNDAGITDTSNIGVEVHQYFDSDYSGLHQSCNVYANEAAFQQDMGLIDADGNAVFANWIQANKMKVFLGEFGGGYDANCIQDYTWMFNYMNEHAYNATAPNNGGFIGWTIWRANRHGTPTTPYTVLQAADPYVYDGVGIVQGPGNVLMTTPVASYLDKP